MATQYRAIQPTSTANPIGYVNSNDPRKAAANNRQRIAGQGDALISQDNNLADQYRSQAGGVEDYLDPIQSNMAEGNGGYSPTEAAAINFSPQQQQDLVTGAGISAGTGTAAAVNGAQRAADASGGSPMALAAYRARAAQTEGAQSSDAMTKARIAGHDAAATGATTTGNARLGQQDKALNYYQGLGAQKTSASQNEEGLAHGAYGTETSGTNGATGQVLSASQTPSTFDKVLGAAAGAAKGFLADGYLDDAGTDAVVGEDGPEAIIEGGRPSPKGVMHWMSGIKTGGTDAGPMMADGDPGSGEAPEFDGAPPGGETIQGSGETRSRGGALMDYLRKSRQKPAATAQPQEQWNKTTPYSQAGEAAGMGAKALASFLADGTDGSQDNDGGNSGSPWWKDLATYGIKSAAHSILPSVFMADGMAPQPSMAVVAPQTPQVPQSPKIITSPTRVHLDKGDTVVPLSYRPKAKVRPSAAIAAFSPRVRPSYGAAHA